MDSVTDRDRGFDDDRRLCFLISGGFLDKLEDAFDSRAVKEILFGVVVCGRGDDDEVSFAVGRCAVYGSGESELAFSFFRFRQIFFDILVLDRRDKLIDLFYLFGKDVDCRDFIVLSQQDRQGQAYIAGARNGDPVAAFYGDGGSRCRVHEQVSRIKTQCFSQSLELVDRRGKVL